MHHFLLTVALLVGDGHAEQNPLYRDLLQAGVKLGPGKLALLPAAAMADGLTAAQQRALLETLPGRQVPVEELLRPSTVAPFVLKFHDLDSGVPHAPGRGVDLYFVAQGKLADLEKSDFLDRLLNSGRNDATIAPLEAGRLSALGLKPGPQEGWAFVSVPLMDRVLLQGANHTRWSRTAESIVVAARLDERFAKDPAWAGRWTLLQRDEAGKLQPQPGGHAYEGLAYTLKITQLHEPTGMLFVEWHLVFSEPEGWFSGANLLRSKLPLVLQTKVRGFRRDLVKSERP